MVTPEAVEQAKALVNKSAANHRYFFRELSSAEWVRPLRDAGFFQEPPKDGAFWPESRYLVRVAEEDPDSVYAVAMGIPQTDNVNVHRDLVEVAVKMSPDKAAAIGHRFLPSFRNGRFSWIDDKLCQLIERLATEGKPEDALALAMALLEVLPPSPSDDEDGGAAMSFLARCRTRLRPHEYETCSSTLAPVLAAAAGVSAVTMFGGLLADAIRFEEQAETGGPEDFSTIWVPALDWPGPTYSDPKRVLAHALSTSAESTMEQRPGERGEVLTYLRQGPYKVFWRIEMHLLRLFHHGFEERINEVIGSRECYEDSTVEREYRQLVRAQFQYARPEVQRQYLTWVEELFDFATEEDKLRRFFGEGISEDEVKVSARRRALARLSGLREALPERWQGRYDDLAKEVGEPSSPHAPPHTSQARCVAPISPTTAEQLAGMNNAELIAFLRDWKPPPREPGCDWLSPEGLGRQLEQLAKENPSRFVRSTEDLKQLEPTYVRHVLEGIQGALANETQIAWEPVVEFCSWVMEQGIEHEAGDRFDFWQDKGWDWAKDAAASLVATGLRSQSCPLPIDLREAAWKVVQALTTSPDPSPEDDERDIKENNNLLDRALNCRRGKAMHRVVHYALWLRRHFEREELKTEIDRGLDVMPEVRAVLEWHLNPRNESSPAVRTVYGEFFPWLVLLDETWAHGARQRVFSVEGDDRILGHAAWGTYVILCPPYDKVVETLREEYLWAICNLGSPWPVRILHNADPDGRLAEHLIQLYARAGIRVDDELWQRFWQTEADEIRAHALTFIGRTVDAEKEPLDDDVQKRFISLAGERIQAAEKASDRSSHIREMRALGWWFANEAFDERWAVENLNRVLDVTEGQIDAEFILAERLAKASASSPRLAVTCLRKMVLRTTEIWGVLGKHDEIQMILRNAIEANEAQATMEAREAVNALVSKGFDQYRNVLKA